MLKRCSSNCLDFLCHTLRYNHSQRAEVQYLEKHVSMSPSAAARNTTVLPISLKEMTALSHNWNTVPSEFQGASEK